MPAKQVMREFDSPSAHQEFFGRIIFPSLRRVVHAPDGSIHFIRLEHPVFTQFDYPDGWQDIKHGYGWWNRPIRYIGGEEIASEEQGSIQADVRPVPTRKNIKERVR